MLKGISINHQQLRDINTFSSVTPEFEFKFAEIRPSPHTWRFEKADRVYQYALAHSKQIRGNCLVWHQGLPDWLQELSVFELRKVLKDYIYTVVGRYSQVEEWDVVNEAIADNGSLRPSVWNSIPNLFEKAFLWTHEANPYARLYWNDYRPCVTPKWDKTLQVIDELRDIAIPIHGVGIQHHYHLRRFLVEKITNWVSTRSLVEQIKHRSLRVAFTEVSVLDDIGMPWLKDKALEELYAIAQELDVSSFTLWHCCESFRR